MNHPHANAITETINQTAKLSNPSLNRSVLKKFEKNNNIARSAGVK
jgi:hypothetical protein